MVKLWRVVSTDSLHSAGCLGIVLYFTKDVHRYSQIFFYLFDMASQSSKEVCYLTKAVLSTLGRL